MINRIDNMRVYAINEYGDEEQINLLECQYCGECIESGYNTCETCQEVLDMVYEERFLLAICKVFDVSPRDIEVDKQLEDIYIINGIEYFISDHDTVYDMVVDRVHEQLCTLSPEFLETKTSLNKEFFIALQTQYKGNNDYIEALIDMTCGLDTIIDDSIAYPMESNFNNPYESEVNQFEYDNINYYIYEVNKIC